MQEEKAGTRKHQTGPSPVPAARSLLPREPQPRAGGVPAGLRRPSHAPVSPLHAALVCERRGAASADGRSRALQATGVCKTLKPRWDWALP